MAGGLLLKYVKLLEFQHKNKRNFDTTNHVVLTTFRVVAKKEVSKWLVFYVKPKGFLK